MILLLIIYMAVLSRMCGGMPPKLPSFTDQVLFAAPFAAVTFIATHNIWLAGFAGITACLGKLTGHGRFISVFEPMRGKPEKVEVISAWILPYLPTWAYKATGLALCEAVVWSGISIAISPMLMLGSLCRPMAYLIGWGIWLHAERNGLIRRTQTEKNKSVKQISFLPDFIGRHTAIGEFLTGAFNGVFLIWAIHLIR